MRKPSEILEDIKLDDVESEEAWRKIKRAYERSIKLEQRSQKMLDVCYEGDGRKVYRSTDDDLMEAAEALHDIVGERVAA
jgi:hypothetical protein